MGLADDFAVSEGLNYQQNPYIIHNNSEFLVVWDDLRSGDSKDIYGRSIGVTNATDLTPDLSSSEYPIVTTLDQESYPSLAYNPSLNETLLAYRNYTPPTDTYDYIILSAGSISGSISSGETGDPISGVTVNAYSEDTGQFFSDTTIGDGSYQLDNLTPGCYRIDVFAITDIGHVLPARRSVEIDTGDHAIEDFVLAPGGYTVEGTVNSAGAILEVFFDNDAAQVFAHTFTDPATGSFRFYNLPAGEAEIWGAPICSYSF